MVRKFLIKYHTDAEITAFLQKMAEQGHALSKVVGNNFFFEERPYAGARVCALTLYRTGNEFSTELQVREELTRIRKQGWDCLVVGKQETLKDSCRHVYLIEEIRGSSIPVAEDRSEKRAQLRGKFKSFSNLLLCALYTGALVFLLSTSLIKVVTDNAYIVLTVLFTLLMAMCCFLCIAAFVNCFFIGKKNRLIDISTNVLLYVLILFATFLFLDSFAQDRGHSERLKIGTSVYHLYSDDVPVSLENLGADTSNIYRTTRYLASESFAAKQVYCFDESFGIKEGQTVYDNSSVSDVLFVSYTFFNSPYAFLRNAVASQIIPSGSVRRTELEKCLGLQQVFSSPSGTYCLCNGDRVLMIKSGFFISEENLKLFTKVFFQ